MLDFINKINSLVTDQLILWIPMDKWVHAIGIVLIWLFLHYIVFNKWLKTINISILLIISFWKEFFDKYIRLTNFSTWDIIADITWIIIFLIIIILID